MSHKNNVKGGPLAISLNNNRKVDKYFQNITYNKRQAVLIGYSIQEIKKRLRC